MDKFKVLWADDEIDILKPHLMFLEEKGYHVETATNGEDAFDMVLDEDFDIVLLDENMPGLTGLETLTRIKESKPSLPVVMITKSEEESIMEEAIGSKISDYLIKPVNPNQILLALKKNLDKKRLVSEQTTSSYQREFREIGMRLNDSLDYLDWSELYRKLVYWELELGDSSDSGMNEILQMQKTEANSQFGKFIEENYIDWINGREKGPIMSHTLIKDRVSKKLSSSKPTFLVVIDNLRFDQWKTIQPILSENYRIEDELYYGILPTATAYARNSIFSGLLPTEIAKRHPNLWKNEEDEGGKNLHEEELLSHQLKRLGKDISFSYNKITNLKAGKKLADTVYNYLTNDLNVIVYNFVDMLSHAKTDMEVIRELADDEAAYRSLTLSWFEHSPLLEILSKLAEKDVNVIITTDHGSIKVTEPSKVIGDRNTNANLRYKQGKNLNYQGKDVLAVHKPEEAFLPKSNVSSKYIFAKDDKFFVYPNNYNYYVNWFLNTFQHGGISLEEVLIPLAYLTPK